MKFKLSDAEVVSIHDRGQKCDLVFRGVSSETNETEERTVSISPNMEARDRYVTIAALAKMQGYRFPTVTISVVEEEVGVLSKGEYVVCMLT